MKKLFLFLIVFLFFSSVFAGYDDSRSECEVGGYDWLSGSVTGNNSACCGDDGLVDDFYNGTINDTSHFCTNGVFSDESIDDNQTTCEAWGYNWFTGFSSFADDFESGDLSYWDFIMVNDGGYATYWYEATTSFKQDGSYGLKFGLENSDNSDNHNRIRLENYTDFVVSNLSFWYRPDSSSYYVDESGGAARLHVKLRFYDSSDVQLGSIDYCVLYKSVDATYNEDSNSIMVYDESQEDVWNYYSSNVQDVFITTYGESEWNKVNYTKTELESSVASFGSYGHGKSLVYFDDFSFTNEIGTGASCCGDDGVGDYFYNSSHSCSVDDTQFICEDAGYEFLTGSTTGFGASCCGDDWIRDGFYNSTHICYDGWLSTEADLSKGFCEAQGYGWLESPEMGVAVAAGSDYSCVLTNSGNVVCWGQFSDYNEGNAVSVIAGGYHTCILTNESNVVCWGSSYHGRTDNYNNGDAVSVSSGSTHNCVLTNESNVVCWGDNGYGQSNDYTNGDAIGVSAGSQHTCVLTNSGNVVCWGG